MRSLHLRSLGRSPLRETRPPLSPDIVAVALFFAARTQNDRNGDINSLIPAVALVLFVGAAILGRK